MESKDINSYIEQLKSLEKRLNPNDMSDDFVHELNNVLTSLNKDIETKLGRQVQNPPMMEVNFKKLHPDAVEPTYAKDGDAGLDLTIVRLISDDLFQTRFGTGLAFEIPRGYVGLVVSRSSVRNHKVMLANCIGILDSGFRGEVELTFNKFDNSDYPEYKVGDTAAQLIIIPFPMIKLVEKKELSKTERNTDGHGSSGK